MIQSKALKREVQKRKLVEEELRLSDAQLQLLVNSIVDYAIFLLTPDGYIRTWNPGAERIKGYKADEIIGHHFSIFYPEEAIERGFPAYELEVAAREGHFEDEGWRLRKDGSPIWANVIITALRDEKGTLVGFSKITRDLTERKALEDHLKETNARLEKQVEERTQALAEANELYRLVINGSNDGFWDWDIVKDERFWSDRLFQNLGRTRPPKPMTTEEAMALIHPQDHERIHQVAQAHFADPSVPYEVEFRLLHSSGHYRYFISRGEAVRDAQGKPIRMSGMIADITERKQVETDLLAMKHRLEQSNRDLSHFASIAAHDLQAPLRKVHMFLGMIQEEEKGKLSERSHDFLNRTVSAVENMQNLITDLLAFSRVSKEPPALKPVDLELVLAEAMQNLEPAIREKDALIHFRNLGNVMGDALQLTQLMQNLLENAIKYQPPNQQPVIEVESHPDAPHSMAITVKDNGIGFSQQYAQKVFMPFQRLHGKGSPYTGTGIGLAICQRIVERHSGTIEVQSTEGRGTTFTIRLPHHENASPTAKQQPSTAES